MGKKIHASTKQLRAVHGFFYFGCKRKNQAKFTVAFFLQV